MRFIKEIRLARKQTQVNWSRQKEIEEPGTKGETLVELDASCVCVIRTSTYASSIAHFNKLVKEARKDFPDILDEDIQVVRYGGNYYARTFGIEFKCPIELTAAPDGWTKIQELELT